MDNELALNALNVLQSKLQSDRYCQSSTVWRWSDLLGVLNSSHLLMQTLLRLLQAAKGEIFLTTGLINVHAADLGSVRPATKRGE
jgi:hypothetical protein